MIKIIIINQIYNIRWTRKEHDEPISSEKNLNMIIDEIVNLILRSEIIEIIELIQK